MMRPPKTAGNPHQLTYKQKLVIEKVLDGARSGKGVRLVDAHAGVYGTTNKKSIRRITTKNYHRENFRAALIEGLMDKKVIGANSLIETTLLEGLDATDARGNVDYNARLKYAQEINKISGVYAPEQKQTVRANFNIDLTPEQINEKIRALQSELEE